MCNFIGQNCHKQYLSTLDDNHRCVVLNRFCAICFEFWALLSRHKNLYLPYVVCKGRRGGGAFGCTGAPDLGDYCTPCKIMVVISDDNQQFGHGQFSFAALRWLLLPKN